jgi:methylmalonyl-CoA mutase cobalamin-binding subunit
MSESLSFKILDEVSVSSKVARDTSHPVMLVGFQDQENLGLGYLASTLRLHGYQVKVFDIGQDAAQILEAAKALDPVLIGFSLIFQFYVDRFRSLMGYLRDNGVSCHFTMGGHFPSLSYQHTLELLPELDSVVRFEGGNHIDRTDGFSCFGKRLASIKRHRVSASRRNHRHSFTGTDTRSRRIAISGAQFRAEQKQSAGTIERADPGKPRLRSHLFVLLHSHVLPCGAWQGGENAEAGAGGARNANAV